MFSPSDVASMVSTIAAELKGIAPVLAGVANASSSVQNDIAVALDSLQDGAAALAQAEHAGEAQPLISRAMADIDAVLNALASAPLPAWAAIVMRIVQMMVTPIEGIARLVWPAAPIAVAPTTA